MSEVFGKPLTIRITASNSYIMRLAHTKLMEFCITTVCYEF